MSRCATKLRTVQCPNDGTVLVAWSRQIYGGFSVGGEAHVCQACARSVLAGMYAGWCVVDPSQIEDKKDAPATESANKEIRTGDALPRIADAG